MPTRQRYVNIKFEAILSVNKSVGVQATANDTTHSCCDKIRISGQLSDI